MSDTPAKTNAEKSGEEAIVIKRYANRKLYNTTTSSYVTLGEIAEMVREGLELRIIDYKSKRDITATTLSQIVFENEKKQRLIPSQTLRDIIQSGGEVISDFLQKRVNLGGLKEEAERRAQAFEKLYHKAPFTREEATRLIRELFNMSSGHAEDWQRRIDERLRAQLGPAQNPVLLRRELDALHAQVELLGEKLATLERLLASREPPAAD